MTTTETKDIESFRAAVLGLKAEYGIIFISLVADPADRSGIGKLYISSKGASSSCYYQEGNGKMTDLHGAGEDKFFIAPILNGCAEFVEALGELVGRYVDQLDAAQIIAILRENSGAGVAACSEQDGLADFVTLLPDGSDGFGEDDRNFLPQSNFFARIFIGLESEMDFGTELRMTSSRTDVIATRAQFIFDQGQVEKPSQSEFDSIEVVISRPGLTDYVEKFRNVWGLEVEGRHVAFFCDSAAENPLRVFRLKFFLFDDTASHIVRYEKLVESIAE